MNNILFATVAAASLPSDSYAHKTERIGGDGIQYKPIPRRAERRSYLAQVRAARRRRNVSKRGGAQ